jgi:hypothetical protein
LARLARDDGLEGRGPEPGDAGLEAVARWISTALDCRAVEAFSFDPGVDPVHAC